MSAPVLVVHADQDTVADAVAARLLTRLVDAQAARGSASVLLTGGGICGAALAAVAGSTLRDTVDWSRLDVWWGDERFLPAGDPERNETLARSALLDAVPLEPGRVHPMPASDGPYTGPEAAAQAYARELAAAARPEDHGPIPSFDVALLGLGEDGHVASLFPEQPALYEEAPVAAVRGAPKPPPTRITLTLPAINAARQVWVVAAGGAKATAVRLTFSGTGYVQIPATGVRGRSATLWLIDRAAASKLPRGLDRASSP